MTNKFSIKFSAAVIFCLLTGIGQIFAQSTVTGGIRGQVSDPQGAVVSNATVTVTNEGTGSAQTVSASTDGTFRFSNLQPGSYTVEVTSSGFAAFKQEKVVVEVGQLTPLTIPLGIEGASATVEVTSEAPVINTNDN